MGGATCFLYPAPLSRVNSLLNASRRSAYGRVLFYTSVSSDVYCFTRSWALLTCGVSHVRELYWRELFHTSVSSTNVHCFTRPWALLTCIHILTGNSRDNIVVLMESASDAAVRCVTPITEPVVHRFLIQTWALLSVNLDTWLQILEIKDRVNRQS